jgi:ppGpp synthetase/RelA/SpoT-type nucleotidyltranferase
MTKWTEPKYSGSRRTKAGIALANGQESDEDMVVIDNWRSSHSMPLQVMKMMLKGRAKSVDPDAIVAQRLKRLPSIRAKLQRETMRLQQMQDLGGCRAIVKDMSALNALALKFKEGIEKNPKRQGFKRHDLVETKNYLENPKADGYRSLHYIFAYRTNTPHLTTFDGHLIEVQLRTRLQHAWATAVEIVDTFTGQSLKSALRTNVGDANWRRFFVLMSSELAAREKTPVVPNTPALREEMKRELRELADAIDVERVLGGLGAVVEKIGKGPKSTAYVLRLDAKARTITVMGFASADLAQQRLFDEERLYSAEPTVQVVQVSVEKMQALQAAYPNYYLDTTMFLQALRRAIGSTRTSK